MGTRPGAVRKPCCNVKSIFTTHLRVPFNTMKITYVCFFCKRTALQALSFHCIRYLYGSYPKEAIRPFLSSLRMNNIDFNGVLVDIVSKRGGSIS